MRGQNACAKKQGCQDRKCRIFIRPEQAKALTRPEHAKRRQHRTCAELERVFRHAIQRPMCRGPDAQHQKAGKQRAKGRQPQKAAPCPDRSAALRSQPMPNSKSSTPIATCYTPSGTLSRNGPRIRTIVKASTTSTS